MAYSNHFRLADDVITHLDTFVSSIPDPYIQSKYVGFVATVSVTVYELAIKDIFIDFAEKKHKVLGAFTRQYFDRINGRIRTSDLKNEYMNRFGEKYVKRFNKRIAVLEKDYLQKHGISVLSSYGNIITWRNEFAHGGQLPSTVTYSEITKAYEAGKQVIHCLAGTMQR